VKNVIQFNGIYMYKAMTDANILVQCTMIKKRNLIEEESFHVGFIRLNNIEKKKRYRLTNLYRYHCTYLTSIIYIDQTFRSFP
jgi:hypothetical protein